MTRPRRRDVLIIASDILSILSRKGAMRKTRLMNLANLNPQSFARLAARLQDLDLIEMQCRKGKCLYTITRKGSFFLSLLRALQRGFNIEDEEEQAATRRTLLAKITDAARSLGLTPQPASIVIGASGTSYLHDIALLAEEKKTIAVNMLLSNEPGNVRQYELGALIASCIDTGIPHLIIIPPSLEEYYTRMFSQLRNPCRTYIMVWQRDDIEKTITKLVKSS